MSEQQSNGQLVRIGGLWINESRGGEKYMSGNLSATSRLLIFKNTHKESANQPDYILYIAPVVKPDDVPPAPSDAESMGDITF